MSAKIAYGRSLMVLQTAGIFRLLTNFNGGGAAMRFLFCTFAARKK